MTDGKFAVPTAKDAAHKPQARFRHNPQMPWRRGRLGLVVEYGDGSALFIDTTGEPWRECEINLRFAASSDRSVEVGLGPLEAMRSVCEWCAVNGGLPDHIRLAARYAVGMDDRGEWLKNHG
jgi:hypothetical protein